MSNVMRRTGCTAGGIAALRSSAGSSVSEVSAMPVQLTNDRISQIEITLLYVSCELLATNAKVLNIKLFSCTPNIMFSARSI